jgi:hypothetical protein
MGVSHGWGKEAGMRHVCLGHGICTVPIALQANVIDRSCCIPLTEHNQAADGRSTTALCVAGCHVLFLCSSLKCAGGS